MIFYGVLAIAAGFLVLTWAACVAVDNNPLPPKYWTGGTHDANWGDWNCYGDPWDGSGGGDSWWD
jgi:hypothetical protein